MSCARIAAILDEEMIERSNTIASGITACLLSSLPRRDGVAVAKELGHRYLLRFVMESQLNLFLDGSPDVHYVTPTPYDPADSPSWLALPRPENPREYVMLLDASRIPEIQGPRRTRGGHGIEYVLPRGFPKEAIYLEWPLKVT